jgi:hypothetical protein
MGPHVGATDVAHEGGNIDVVVNKASGGHGNAVVAAECGFGGPVGVHPKTPEGAEINGTVTTEKTREAESKRIAEFESAAGCTVKKTQTINKNQYMVPVHVAGKREIGRILTKGLIESDLNGGGQGVLESLAVTTNEIVRDEGEIGSQRRRRENVGNSGENVGWREQVGGERVTNGSGGGIAGARRVQTGERERRRRSPLKGLTPGK